MATKIEVTSSPFHRKAALSEAEAAACRAVYDAAARAGRAWKSDWLASQTDFTFKAGMSAAMMRHYAGELRSIGEYIARCGWAVGLTWHAAASNSRGSHMVKRDITAADRKIHAAALEKARAAGVVGTGYTWAAQTAFLNGDEGKGHLAAAVAEIEAAAEAAKAEKPKKGK